MAKIKDMIEMAPTSFKTSLLDVLMALDPSKTKKYVPLMLKVLVNKIEEGERDRDRDSVRQDYLNELKEYYGILNLPHTMDPKVVARLLEMVGSDITKDLMNFVDSNEKGYFKGLDITTISNRKELANLNSLTALTKIGKALTKQVQKDFEDEEWLVVRPFSFESSVKYGYGSKWCTAMEKNAEHFFRYTNRGTLIYCINKKTGDKVAVFHEIQDGISFWNTEDIRIDSMFSNLPSYIMDVIRGIITDKQVTNRSLNPKVWENSKNLWENSQSKNRKMEILDEPTPVRDVVEVNFESAELVDTERNYTDFVMEDYGNTTN
jgi:hypothetical protein